MILQALKLYFLKNIELYLVFAFLIFCVIAYLIIIKLLTLKDKLLVSTQRVDYLESCNKTVSVLYDDVRGFKHDFNNIVQVIGGYISLNDVDGLKKYYKNLAIDFQKIRNLNLINLNEIDEPALYSLIFKKYYEAKEKNIQINISSFANLKEIKVNMYEYSRIVGILLDNAIEAAEGCNRKMINIKFFEEDNNVNCLIENTYNNENVEVNKIFEKNYSTKSEKKNHGIGLWKVKEILKTDSNIILKTEIDGMFFRQLLSIKKIQ